MTSYLNLNKSIDLIKFCWNTMDKKISLGFMCFEKEIFGQLEFLEFQYLVDYYCAKIFAILRI